MSENRYSSDENFWGHFSDLSDEEVDQLSKESALFARLARRVEGVVGNRDLAHDWLRTPNRALGGDTPLAHAQTEAGAREVEDLLGRLAHGVIT